MFKLSFFLDVADGRPGMLIPIFSSQNTNMPYAQQMDEFLYVQEVLPFLDYENYPTVPYTDEDKILIVGDAGFIAFRSTNDDIVVGKIEDVTEYISTHAQLLRDHPQLHSQVLRVIAAPLPPSYESWREVAAATFADTAQQKLWVDSEHSIFQKQRRIWEKIDPSAPSAQDTGSAISFVSLREFGTEYLIQWLSDRTNYKSGNWSKTWHFVQESVPFDDRLPSIALSWVYAIGNEYGDLQQAKSVIYSLLEDWARLDDDLDEFGEFLASELADDVGLLYAFSRPEHFFRELMAVVALFGNVDDFLKIARNAAAELGAQPHVRDAILEWLIDMLTERLAPSSKEAELAREIVALLQIRYDDASA